MIAVIDKVGELFIDSVANIEFVFFCNSGRGIGSYDSRAYPWTPAFLIDLSEHLIADDASVI